MPCAPPGNFGSSHHFRYLLKYLDLINATSTYEVFGLIEVKGNNSWFHFIRHIWMDHRRHQQRPLMHPLYDRRMARTNRSHESPIEFGLSYPKVRLKNVSAIRRKIGRGTELLLKLKIPRNFKEPVWHLDVLARRFQSTRYSHASLRCRYVRWRAPDSQFRRGGSRGVSNIAPG